MNNKDYFLELLKYSKTIFDKLPIELEPKPLDYVLGILKQKIDEYKSKEVQIIKSLRDERKIAKIGNLNKWQGLNSIGMLMDRFTILLIREWCLRNKINKNVEKANSVYQFQTLDIIEAMVNAAPGSSSINSKITNIKETVEVSCWEEAYYGLLTVNLLLWESQEILYIKDINALPCEELRSYISWFSKGNIIRNEYIQLCEELYWSI